MATMIGLFSSIGDHIPIFREGKLLEANPEGFVNRLHYRGTCMFLLVACLMVTCTEWISGTGSVIECMHGPGLPEDMVRNYCYIQGTFSVPAQWVDHDTQLGQHVSQTGVGPYNPEKDFVEYKAYYQWVPFMLFLQGIMFYIPHVLYQAAEEKKVKTILGSLNMFVLNRDSRSTAQSSLIDYFVETMGSHDFWSIKVILAHSLYLIHVIGQIFLTDCFLGYEFSKYGVSAASFLEQEPEDRIDPMSRVFPRVTKCTFHKYGPSGSIQRHDIQCVLPINIINEKIYVFLWFWFMILACLTIFDLLHHIGLLSFRVVRYMILKRKLMTAPKFKVREMDIDLSFISRSLSYGDWKLCYHIIRNMDSLTCAEWLHALTLRLRIENEMTSHNLETLPLKSRLTVDL